MCNKFKYSFLSYVKWTTSSWKLFLSYFRAAFQFGVKMSDGRKTRRTGPKDEKAKLDRDWNKISQVTLIWFTGNEMLRKKKPVINSNCWLTYSIDCIFSWRKMWNNWKLHSTNIKFRKISTFPCAYDWTCVWKTRNWNAALQLRYSLHLRVFLLTC